LLAHPNPGQKYFITFAEAKRSNINDAADADAETRA